MTLANAVALYVCKCKYFYLIDVFNMDFQFYLCKKTACHLSYDVRVVKTEQFVKKINK